MADLGLNLNMTSGGIPIGGDVTITVTDDLNSSGRLLTSTTSTAFKLGTVTNPGYIWVRNHDETDDIKIQSSVAGTEVARCPAGGQVCFQFEPSVTAPAWQATANTPEMSYKVVSA